MGMFDTVIVEGLKLKAPREITSFIKSNSASFPNEFQTKDLDCLMGVYKINENGVIFEEQRKLTGKKIPFADHFKDWKDNRSFLERLYWKVKNLKYSSFNKKNLVEETKTILVKSKITNTFTMLSVDEIGGRSLSLDYEVKAVEGKVKSVKLFKWELESEKEAAKRHKRDSEFKQKMDESFAKHRKFRSNWYYPILKEIYNPAVFFTKISLQAICNALIRWSYRWHGV